jgi:hypothetical protein
VEFVNVSGETQELPSLGEVVPAGATVAATGDAAKSLTGNPSFERADKRKNNDGEKT